MNTKPKTSYNKITLMIQLELVYGDICLTWWWKKNLSLHSSSTDHECLQV